MRVNGAEIIKFKAKDSEIVANPLCLGNISEDFSVANIFCCSNINDPYAKLCVPGIVENISIKVFNLMS